MCYRQKERDDDRERACSARLVPCSFIFGLCVGIGGLFLLLCSQLMHAPYGRDQGIFVWQAQEVLRGGMPYLDAWDHKGPLSVLIYSFLGAVFGFSENVLHSFDILLFGGMLVAVGCLWGKDRLAGVSSAFLLFCFLAPDWWRSAQPDLWTAEFLVFAVLLLSSGRSWAAAVAGVLFAAMSLAKPVYLICFVAVPVLVYQDLVQRRVVDLKRVMLSYGVFFCLSAGGVGFGVGVWLFLAGALPAFWDAVVTFNLNAHLLSHAGYGTGFGFWPPLRGMLYPSGALLDFSFVVTGGCATMALWAGIKERRWGLLLLWMCAWLAMAAQQKFYLYHYLPSLAVMALLAGQGVGLAWQMRWRKKMTGIIAGLILFFGMGVFALARVQGTAVYESRGEGFSAALISEAAEQVRARTKPDQRIMMWGMDAGVLALADRPSVVRYGFNYPLRAVHAEARRDEVMPVLQRDPPTLIVVQRGDGNSLVREDSVVALESFIALKDFISAGYSPVWENDGFIVYCRNGERL